MATKKWRPKITDLVVIQTDRGYAHTSALFHNPSSAPPSIPVASGLIGIFAGFEDNKTWCVVGIAQGINETFFVELPVRDIRKL